MYNIRNARQKQLLISVAPPSEKLWPEIRYLEPGMFGQLHPL